MISSGNSHRQSHLRPFRWLWQALGAKIANGCAPLFSKSKKWAEVCNAIEKAAAELRPRVDAACRRWMRTGAWPRMSLGIVARNDAGVEQTNADGTKYRQEKNP